MNDPRGGARRPYMRPMAGWWRKNPYFVRYMMREGTALVVAAYAFFLLAGLVCLMRGPVAYEHWARLLRTPTSIALHLAALAGMLYHAWTWFEIMPKTLPPILVHGKRVPAGVITWSGVAATLAASIVVFLAVWSLS